MILQQWIMSCCDGKPTEALRRIEAVSDEPVSQSTIYRAMRAPLALPGKLARVVVKASDEQCSLAELVDVELIRAAFVYTNPDLRKRGMEIAVVQAQAKAAAWQAKLERVQQAHEKQLNEVARLQRELAEAFPLPRRHPREPFASEVAEALEANAITHSEAARILNAKARRRRAAAAAASREAARPAKRVKRKRSARRSAA